MDMTREQFLSSFRLHPESAAPIYTQIADYLRYQVKSGVLKPGDKMIGENDIVELLGVSRTTVRAAINQLVEEGYIVRYRGKGSYIAEPKLKRNINYLYNFTENIGESLGPVVLGQIMFISPLAKGVLPLCMIVTGMGGIYYLINRKK